MTSLRRALIALGIAGVAAGVVASLLVLSSDFQEDPGVTIAFGLAVGWSFIGTGLYAWWRRPDNSFGALMVGVGFAFFAGALGASDIPGVFAVGLLTGALSFAFLIHLLLSFPSGRLESRAARILAAIAYVETTVVQVATVLVTDSENGDCKCTANPLLVTHNQTVSDVVVGFQAITSALALLAMTVFLVHRWRTAPRPLKGLLGPMYLAGAVTMVLYALTLTADVTNFSDGVEAGVDLAALVTFTAIPYGFLVGLLRSRIARGGAVSELVTRVGDRTPEGSMRDLLADALGDPSLELAYWLPDREVYVAEDGAEVTLPEPGAGRSVTPVVRDGECVAAIIHDPSLDEEPEFVRGAAAAAALALESERLAAELRARVEELRASRGRLVRAGLDERRRLERDLHDGAQQRLVSLRLALGMAQDRVDEDPDMTRMLLDRGVKELESALAELRELARGIHPGVLTDHGLGPALSSLADRAPLPVDVEADADRLPPAVESAAYFMVAEALTNVAKYSRAEHARVSVERRNGHVRVEVSDDGLGGADANRGSGLRGLADRIAALDGRLTVESPDGAGTVVRADIPCA